METIHTQTAKAVWERVMARQGEPLTSPALQPEQALGQPNFSRLIQAELASAAVCDRLAQSYQGWERQTLQVLSRQEREHAALLKSICYIVQGTLIRTQKALPEMTGSPVECLRHLYLQKQMLQKTYGELSRQEASFRSVLALLETQEQKQAQTLFHFLHARLTANRAHTR